MFSSKVQPRNNLPDAINKYNNQTFRRIVRTFGVGWDSGDICCAADSCRVCAIATAAMVALANWSWLSSS